MSYRSIIIVQILGLLALRKKRKLLIFIKILTLLLKLKNFNKCFVNLPNNTTIENQLY